MNHVAELWLRMENNYEGLNWTFVEFAPFGPSEVRISSKKFPV